MLVQIILFIADKNYIDAFHLGKLKNVCKGEMQHSGIRPQQIDYLVDGIAVPPKLR